MRGEPRPALLALLFALACSSPKRDATEHATLPPGVVARVADLDIAATTVAEIARAQTVSAPTAAERAISDAVFAAALSAEPGRRDAAAVATRSAHARALVEALQEAAAETGPASDEEIEKLTAERWTELDRPVAVRTIHAVALVKKPEDDAAARELAERVAREVAGVREPDAFLKQARALAGGPVELRVERLPLVVPDGRTLEPNGAAGDARFDEDFTRAAHALVAAGDQSPLVKTRFGYHVIMLEERQPEHRLSLEERRRLLGPVAIARRAERQIKGLLKSLRDETALDVTRGAEQLTAQVGVAP